MILHDEKVTVGDRVWDYHNEWGEGIATTDEDLVVYFDNGSSYYYNPKSENHQKSPTLFWGESEMVAL